MHRSQRIRVWSLALVVGVLAATIAGAEEEQQDTTWKGKLALGGNVTSGNSDAVQGSLAAAGEREWSIHLLRLGLVARYGRSNGETNDDDQSLSQYYRYSFAERFYAYGDLFEGRDSVQDIDLRFIGNVGPGWRAWKGEEKQFLDLEAGIGYRYENYSGNKTPSRNDVTGRAALLYSNVFGIAEFTQSGEFLLPFNDTNGWFARAATTLSFPLTERWSFANSLGIEYLNEPVGMNKEFDLDYTVALVVEF